MASINKLSIRGVRSFSPTDDEQVIEFCFPVTIILGANGCGKTTIIEALKYAMTGALPPGNRSGQAFIHDPKSCGQANVKAAIKLRFTNKAGHTMVVIRSMEVTQKKTTLSFKALDGIIRTHDAQTGERVSMSHKCSELDRQIPALMGISKAIMEHVVFCHQEDSSWPLQEGAVLKKRFDEIFDSTRYVKALEAIRKTKLEKSNVSKETKADLASLESHKYAATGFRKELNECEDKMESLREDHENLKTEIEKEEKIQNELSEALREFHTARREIQDLESKVKESQSVMQSKRSLLEQDMTQTHTLSELTEMANNNDNNDEEAKDKFEKLQDDMEDKREQVEKLIKELQDMSVERGQLLSDNKTYENLLNERWKTIKNISDQHKVEIPDTFFSSSSTDTQPSDDSSSYIPKLTQELAQKINQIFYSHEQSLKTDLENTKKKNREKEDFFQKEIGELNSKVINLKNERLKIANTISDAKHEITRLTATYSEATIGSLASSIATSTRVLKSDVEDAKAAKIDAERYLQAVSNDQNHKDIPAKMKANDERYRILNREIEAEKELLHELRQTSDEQVKINSLKEDITKGKLQLKEILDSNEYVWNKYEAYPSSIDFDTLQTSFDKVQSLSNTNKVAFEKAQEEFQAKKSEVAQKNALINHLKTNHQNIMNQVSTLGSDSNRGVTKIKKVINGMIARERDLDGSTSVNRDDDPQQILKHIDEKLSKLPTSEDSEQNIARTVRSLFSLAQRPSGNRVAVICPCCERGMNRAEFDTFIENREKLMDPSSSILMRKLRTENEQNKSSKKQYETWRTLISTSLNDWINYTRLLKESQELEKKIEQDNRNISNLKQQIDRNMKSKLDDLQLKKTDLALLVSDARRISDDANRIKEKEANLKRLLERLSLNGPSCGRTLREVEDEIQRKNHEKEKMMDVNAKLNRDLMKLNEKVSSARKDMEEKEKTAFEKEQQYEKGQESQRRRLALTKSIDEQNDRDKELHSKLSPLESELRSQRNERDYARETAKFEEEKMNNQFHTFRNEVEQLKSMNRKIDALESAETKKKLGRLKEKFTKVQDIIDKRNEEIDALEPELEKIKESIEQRDRFERELRANISLLEDENKVKKLEQQISEKKKQAEEKELSSDVKIQFELSVNQKKKNEESKARCEGRIMSIREQVKALKAKLRTEQYHDIDERHRIKMIEYETIMIGIADLEKYYTALDKALLQYHRLKIEDINKIIRELWSLTYKGEDITNIEIVSGQDSGSRASRSYNYRVVMTKGGATKMDMRGRCSAGQRVLASIVIRLALAETFCLSCGVMTLDEPTTNLDVENKRGLAIALAQIITSRAAQANFQLVTITHDEDFVQMMKHELASHTDFEMPERYFHVSREEATDGKHYSKINAIDWDEI